MHKTYLYLALILCCALPLRAADLTVVVAIDGVDASALHTMSKHWKETNLRSWSEHTDIREIQYSHWLYGGDEALATLMTGVNPAEHGIGSDWYFDGESRTIKNIFVSDRPLGIGTPTGYDCDALLVPTYTDRLRMRQGIGPRIYAIGLHPTTTMVLAGKAANACCWLQQEETTKGSKSIVSYHWCSTTYYREGLPSAADRMNVNGELSRIVRQSPHVDSAVVELALSMQIDKQLGWRGEEDVLLLQLKTPALIQPLMERLIQRLGKDRVRLVVLGLPQELNASAMEEWNMPVKSFNLDRVTALTSSYLMALYGNERWIDGAVGHTLYLNRMLIEYKKMSLETVRRQVAEFLMEFDGIRYACPIGDAYMHADMRPSLHKRFAGDVVFELQGSYEKRYSSSAVMVVNGTVEEIVGKK